MGSRLTPAPTSHPPETGEIDESWEALVVGAIGASRAPKEEDPEVFERPTAVPQMAPGSGSTGLELDFRSMQPPEKAPSLPVSPFSSEPPARESGGAAKTSGSPAIASPHSQPTVGPEPGGLRLTIDPDPRAAPRMPVPGGVRPGPVMPGSTGSGLELAEPPETHSPLDLVETYRRSVASMPAVRTAGAEPGAEKSHENGTLQDMQDRYAVGDFTGALVVAESLLEADPDDEDAKRYAQSCREVLTQMYAARIGPMDQVATVAVPPDQITWLSLDHRAGFLLSLVDGVSSIEEILDVSGMTRLDALRIMYTLVQQNVITLAH